MVMRNVFVIVFVALVSGGLPAQSRPPDAPYRVAYASFGPLDTAIYIADADGRRERLLVDGAVLDMNPSFAADGQSVLFTSRRHGSADIYRVGIDGSRLERLTNDPAFDDQAVMSPVAGTSPSCRRAAARPTCGFWTLNRGRCAI